MAKKHTMSSLPNQDQIQLELFTQKVLHAIEAGESLHLDKSQLLNLLKELSSVIDQLGTLERNIFDSLYQKSKLLETELEKGPLKKKYKRQSKDLSSSKIKIKTKPRSHLDISHTLGTSIMNIGDSDEQKKKSRNLIKIIRKTPFA